MAAVGEALQRVYFSLQGRKYHGDPDCRGLENGQALWDGDEPGYPIGGPYGGGYAVVVTGEQEAYYRDCKRPCLMCLPGGRAPFRSSADFGHRPAQHIVQGRVLGEVCVRCRIVHWRDVWEVDGDVIRAEALQLVKWPCTSALVLGVADQAPDVLLAAA